MAAVGAMGQDLFKLPADGRLEERERERLIESLREVDWSKDQHWVGIAGNFTANGGLSVKGTKEVAYAVHSALADQASAGYHQIRGNYSRPSATPIAVDGALATPSVASKTPQPITVLPWDDEPRIPPLSLDD